ncbi:DUF2834 domain-containing protein [Chamaesiphon sp. OTE_8_metabat_110]|uniref:DUF2834 domain-containing protein n=1 Tax=Chamaesiphon sp. OTE_8_metabat_110 TaxID=2964696 RepID=UPI00286B71E5|nr:DUF2834 domain-containing protein [Chamaesiphon sp. OTE_8_metabat_110]
MRSNQLIFGTLWLLFTGYAFLLAPPVGEASPLENRSDTLQLIIDLSTGKWDGINPLVIALFNLMGVLPMIYACLMLIDGKTQKLRAGLFSAASFGVGAFAILPYLALRVSDPANRVGVASPLENRPSASPIERNGIIKLVDSRWLGISLTIATIVLLSYGISQGNFADFAQQWQTNRFIHVMSLDFCLLTLLLPVLIPDDMKRRHFDNPKLVNALSLIPLFGALYYLCTRPNLSELNSNSAPKTV